MLRWCKTPILWPVVAGTAVALLLEAADPSVAQRGREAFEKRCTGCHALDSAKVGPPLGRIFGRPGAADPDFAYSDALKKAHLKWDEDTLNRWLADPEDLAPGNDMPFRLQNAEERRAIIAYLKKMGARAR